MRKVAIFLAVMVLVGIFVEDIQAGWWRRTKDKVKNAIKKAKELCRKQCPRLCNVAYKIGFQCRFDCKQACGRKRREITSDFDGHVSPISCDFDTYDLNDDGSVIITEFALIMGEDSRSEDVEEVFKLADADGDGFLSRAEFRNGPFVCAKTDNGDNSQGDDDGNQGDGEGSQGDGEGNQGDGEGKQDDGTESQSVETTTPAEEKKRK